MRQPIYRFTFDRAVPMDDVEQALVLALLVVQILHGDAESPLGVGHAFDRRRRVCVVDATTAEGRDLSKLLVGFLAREFGPDALSVRPARTPPADPRGGRGWPRRRPVPGR
jgi:hypothetical protein